ncbi:MAG: MazG nucleotide pyrophosphohydrolase [Pelosinus sp.]|nr:MazG nucleotide pyrophosphohydrolase [Pelosinus sp.]
MIKSIYLPKLNNLTPTLDSTLLKIMEEAGELARAVLHFLPYENMLFPKEDIPSVAEDLLAEVATELLDVAQTCVTMLFVMEESYGIQVDTLIHEHISKLEHKGYLFDPTLPYSITTVGEFKYLNLPRLILEDVTLLTTVCKIQEEIGEFTQFLGKRSGASGERPELAMQAALLGCAYELLDVAQCCFTMMYILAEKHHVNIEELTAEHIAKLRRKGYCI